ncbi:MAG: hypothetical protein F4124_15585 [Acidimicrobiia bacterium]|nr:hypothetical protein [bacterium]MXW57193.1 hypothetical protein [Acidimicrobiia bacterium]MXZ86251.1 hypothetical protein [Acidimicrobiia bacterium]MYB72939.1 hypothetical protein [Acidimicrobiia bacterium]MYG73195.1 hypothetical protein [Acidimicrobiia bacterium]
MTGRRLGLTIGISAIVLFAVFWIGATIWFFGNENPDRLDDREWVAEAEARCAETRDELDRLPQARDAANKADRADQIEAATAVLAEMTADLAASAPGGDDGELVALWIESWRVYLGDRLAHADALRAGEDRQFRVTVDPERGDGVDALLDAFAGRNRMPSCGDPLDIG